LAIGRKQSFRGATWAIAHGAALALSPGRRDALPGGIPAQPTKKYRLDPPRNCGQQCRPLVKRKQPLRADATDGLTQTEEGFAMFSESKRQMTTQEDAKRLIAPGEIGMGVVWLIFYGVTLIAPVALKFAPVGAALAFFAR
jgi:hypothetical protein